MFLKKTCVVCSEIPFSKNSYHIETGQLIALQIKYDFLLKSVFEQILITATVIN